MIWITIETVIHGILKSDNDDMKDYFSYIKIGDEKYCVPMTQDKPDQRLFAQMEEFSTDTIGFYLFAKDDNITLHGLIIPNRE